MKFNEARYRLANAIEDSALTVLCVGVFVGLAAIITAAEIARRIKR